MSRNGAENPCRPTIALTGGGSAGHVLPALAVADALSGLARVNFYGRPSSVEQRLAQRHGLAFVEVPSSGLRRYRSSKNIVMPFTVLRGVGVATRLMRLNRPNVLFSKGSFASVPVAIAAALLRVPIVAHESDHSLGLANRIVGQFASRLLLSFDDTKLPRNLRRKATVVGELVRSDIGSGDPERFRANHGISPDRPVLLVYGGSSGAQRINAAVRSALNELLPLASVVHVVGPGNMRSDLKHIDGYHQFEFLHEEMTDALSVADIVVSRAGANTIAELGALRKPAILVPLPLTVSRGDQYANAAYFLARNEGELLEDDDLSASFTASVLRQLSNINEKSATQGESWDRERVSTKIAELLLEYAKSNS